MWIQCESDPKLEAKITFFLERNSLRRTYGPARYTRNSPDVGEEIYFDKMFPFGAFSSKTQSRSIDPTQVRG